MSNIIVQKFGGTSVSTKENRLRVIEKIKIAKNSGVIPIVVVSAMGRRGEPYATDTLLSLVDSKMAVNNKQAIDMLMCCGEIISSVVLCSELLNEGIDALPLTGGQAGIITDNNFNNASLIDVNNEKIKETIKKGQIPIISGFQGYTAKGYFTTLGRGGSDTSAAIIAAMVKAKRIEIYTDVDGIMTADPRLVENASVIKVLNYDEVFQLADQGAKVIHPKAIEIARANNIPVIIKNIMTNHEGTIINNIGDLKNKRIITSITSTDKRIQVIIKKENKDEYNNILLNIAKAGISLDLINIFESRYIFTIPFELKNDLEKVLVGCNIKYSLKENCSKIALVGSGMRGVPGVMAKIYSALYENNIEVLQTADSHMTIWCLIYTSNLKDAINALHKAFTL